MATRNNPMAGRYFNDPNLAVAMSSLASAFAPPGAEEYLVAEKIRGTRTQNDALMDLYAGANGNLDVLGGVAAGGWSPNQGFENFREQNANERRNQDIMSGDRRFATEVGSADNRFNTQAGLVKGMMDPSGRNAVDPAFMEAIFGPGAPAMTSADPVMPSETQARGRLVQEGGLHLNADDIYALTMEGVPTAEIVDPATGQPRVTYGPTAARDGATPFVNKGAEAKPTPIILVDPMTGEQVGGFAVDGQFVLGDGQTPAPANLVPQSLPQATGPADQLGGTTANKSRYDQTRAAAAETRLLVNDLRGLVQSQAGAAGVVGTFQMLGQDFVQTGRELASALSQDPTTDGIVSPDMLSQLNAMGQTYDPVFREIRAGMLQLAYNNARLNNPSGEVSRFALEREMEALGQGMLGNDQSVLAALDMVERNVTRKEAAAEALLGGQVPDIPAYLPDANAVPGTGAVQQRPRAVNPTTGETVEFDGTQWIPVQ
jgi:hypothetical protein